MVFPIAQVMTKPWMHPQPEVQCWRTTAIAPACKEEKWPSWHYRQYPADNPHNKKEMPEQKKKHPL
jgi:hypothetical protein